MASSETVAKTNKIVTRLTRIFRPDMLLRPVMFNQKGEILTKDRSSMNQVYRELPRETRLRFIVPTWEPTTGPTQQEWEEFEDKLFTTARRIVIRQIRHHFNKLLSERTSRRKRRKRGRPARSKERIKAIQKTIAKWMLNGECKTKTEAVEKAAKLFGDGRIPLHTDTIWRCLRAAKRKKASS